MKIIFKKLLSLIFTIYCIVSITFILMRIAPGNPYSDERSFGNELESGLMATYSVKASFIKQYVFYLKNVFTLNFGPSMKYKDISVGEILRACLPVSFSIGFTAYLIALFLGLIVGYLSAKYKNIFFGKILHSISIFGISIPIFAIAISFVIVFSFKLHIFPVAGWGGLKYIIMPAMILSIPYVSYISNLFRTSFIKTQRKEWIIFAQEREVSKFMIFYKYILKDAIAPIVSYSGPAMAGILTGAVVIENIFAIPGMGTHFINSALNRDYTLLFGLVIVYSIILVILNFFVDYVLKLLNPKIKEI